MACNVAGPQHTALSLQAHTAAAYSPRLAVGASATTLAPIVSVQAPPVQPSTTAQLCSHLGSSVRYTVLAESAVWRGQRLFNQGITVSVRPRWTT